MDEYILNGPFTAALVEPGMASQPMSLEDERVLPFYDYCESFYYHSSTSPTTGYYTLCNASFVHLSDAFLHWKINERLMVDGLIPMKFVG